MAKEYQIEFLTNRCERYLLEQHDSIQNLARADAYGLDELKETFLGKLQLFTVKDIVESPYYPDMSSETKIEIMTLKAFRALKYEKIYHSMLELWKGDNFEQYTIEGLVYKCPLGKDDHVLGANTDTCRTCVLHKIYQLYHTCSTSEKQQKY